MKRFWVLFRKELRELMTPQTLVPIVLIVVVFLGLGKLISQQSKAQSQPQPVLVIDNDDSGASAQVVQLLKQNQMSVALQKHATMPAFAGSIKEKAVIVIPEHFGQDLTQNKPVSLETYTIQNGFSIARLSDTGLVGGVMAQLNAALVAQRMARLVPNSRPAQLLTPVKNDEHLVVGGKVATISPSKVGAYLSSQVVLVPVVLFVVIVFAGQMVAVAMANEKENKTLETLLSAPISRTSIVGAKMMAAGLFASITATAYVFGLHNLQSSFGGAQSVDDATIAAVSQLGLNLSIGSYALLGVVLFLGILAALSIALVLGAFAEDIKSVQSLMLPLTVIMIIPYLATLVSDPQTLPASFRALLYVIPFTYTFQAIPSLYEHNYAFVVFGALYELAFFGVFIVIAAKLFSSDRILTLKLPWVKR